MEIQQNQRFVLDGSLGITNFVNKDKFYDTMEDAVDSFIRQLINVCGPFSRYSLLLRVDTRRTSDAHGSEYDNRAFIKDGRYLTMFSEYVSPVQNYIKSMILYIGTQIDNICHDGTTTSMLFSCYMLKFLINTARKMDEIENPLLATKTTFAIEQAFSKCFETIKETMKKDAITISDIEEMGYSKHDAAVMLAYIQSLTSSGGDKEVAKELSKFFRYMPECAWNDAIGNRLPATENKDKRIEAITNEYEIEVKAQHMGHLKLNYDNNNYYRNEDIDLLVIPTGLPDADIATMELYRFIDESVDKDLVILVPNVGMGNSVIPTIQEKAYKKKIDIIVMSYNVDIRLNTNINWLVEAICAKANKPKFMVQEGIDIENCIIPHVTVLISRSFIKIDKLTPHDDREYPENSHPALVYPDDYIHYTRFKHHLDREIELNTKFHRKDLDVLNVLKSTNTFMHVVHPVIIKLGGLTTEAQAMIPVIEDCSGASMAVIEHGAYLNGIFRLANTAKSLFKTACLDEELFSPSLSEVFDVKMKNLDTYVYGIVFASAYWTSQAIFGPNWKYFNYQALLTNISGLKNNEFIDLTDGSCVNDTYNKYDIKDYFSYLVSHDFDDTGYDRIPPLQPTVFVDELLDRTRELLVKLSVSNSLVVPGSAWLDNKNKKDD